MYYLTSNVRMIRPVYVKYNGIFGNIVRNVNKNTINETKAIRFVF